MTTPLQPGTGEHDDAWLRVQIAVAIGPPDLDSLSDSDLDALLDACRPEGYDEEATERLLARFWVEVAQMPAPQAAIAPPGQGVPPAPASPPPTLPPMPSPTSPSATSEFPVPKSPLLGALGDLTQLGGGFTPTLWTLLALVSGVATLLLVVMLLVRGIRVQVNGPDLAKASPSAKQPSAAAALEDRNGGALLAACSSVARLVNVVDVRWGKGVEPARVGDDFAPGRQLCLESGLATIVYSKGAELLLQGPAMLTIESDHGVFLADGRLTARLTRPQARGFFVRTQKSMIVDEGTEFGVDVAPGGDENIHVFQGKVDYAAVSKDGRPITHQVLSENQGARVRGETQGVSLVNNAGEGFTRILDKPNRDPHTVAYWRFEDRPVGTIVPDSGANHRPIRGTVDCSGNGNDLFTFYPDTAPRFSADVPAPTIPAFGVANHSSLDNSRPPGPRAATRDLYTSSLFSHASPIDIQRINPKQWTIEASVKPVRLDHALQVFVGRDMFVHGAAGAENPINAALAFHITDRDRFAIAFADGAGRFHCAIARQLPLVEDHWYHLAASSDGRALRLYVDSIDGHGYRLMAAETLPPSGDTSLIVGDDTAEWSIGRGKDSNGFPTNWFHGWIDEVRVSDVARDPSAFLFTPRKQGG